MGVRGCKGGWNGRRNQLGCRYPGWKSRLLRGQGLGGRGGQFVGSIGEAGGRMGKTHRWIQVVELLALWEMQVIPPC